MSTHLTEERAERDYDEMITAVGQSPRFYEIVKKKQHFSLTLLALTLGFYILLMLAVAFAPNLVAKPIVEGGVTTWGIIAGFFLIIWTILLTAYYIQKTNRVFDPMNEALLEEAANETLK